MRSKRSKPREETLTPTISILCSALLLVGCSNQPAPDVTATNQGVCVALSKYMPVKYHGATVDAESKTNIQTANAAYRAACNVK